MNTLDEVKEFLQDLVANDVMGVNVEVAEKLLGKVETFGKTLEGSDEETIASATKWLNHKDIPHQVSPDGNFIEVVVGTDNDEYLSLSKKEVDYRAELGADMESEKHCNNCGSEVIADEAGNCPNCGTYLEEEE